MSNHKKVQENMNYKKRYQVVACYLSKKRSSYDLFDKKILLI